MKQATPAVKNLARQLLTLEADGREQSDAEVNAALSALAKLRSHLTKLVGSAGFEALLARALALAKAEVAWLEPVCVQADGTLEGFREAAQLQTADSIAKECAALVAELLGLLVTFIGEALTLRIVQDVWPEVQFDAKGSGVEETPK
ncbi:MAG: hypothetical protein JWN14_3746 [Chthonomonadales bacterium]|nr:hypothetical protein [Chthonomonadales bacterium]